MKYKFRAYYASYMYQHNEIESLNLEIGRIYMGDTYADFDDPELSLMQFTGLKDKNGKEIYESDYLEDQGGNIGEVIWNQDDCSFAVNWRDADILESLYESDSKYFEVIGNIHENPQLLEK